MQAEEAARIRVLTEIAYDYDPRVLQHKEELRLKQEQIKLEREVTTDRHDFTVFFCI